MRILVIDEDVYVARLIQHRLCGHEVVLATNATYAVALAESAQLEGKPFGVIICDYRTPDRRGLDRLTALRSYPAPPLLIMMTGYDSAVEAAFVGDGVLLKPLATSEIVEMIGRIQGRYARMVTRPLGRIRRPTLEVQ